MTEDVADIERRLNAGEWLRPGEVASLLGVARSTVDAYLREPERGGQGLIRYRRRGGGIQRLCHPDDVRKLLGEARRVRGGDGPDT